MKTKILSIIIAIIAIFTIFTVVYAETTVVEPESASDEVVDGAIEFIESKFGDVNEDGKRNAADARLLLRVSAQLDNISIYILTYGDYNMDNQITASDARTALRVSAMLENIECILHGHDMTEKIVEPTCTKDGYTTNKCTRCAYTDETKTNITNAIGHHYELTESITATCTVDGYTVHTCTNCEDFYRTNIKAAGHNFSNWITSGNTKSRKCTRCGYSESEVVEHTTKINYTYTDENGKTQTSSIMVTSEVEVWAPTSAGQKILDNFNTAKGRNESFVSSEGELCWIEGYDATKTTTVLYLMDANNNIDASGWAYGFGIDTNGRRYNGDGSLFGYCPTCGKLGGYGEGMCNIEENLFTHWGASVGF